MLKSQDVVVCLKVQASKDKDWIYENLAEELNMSQSQVYDALKRADESGIYNFDRRTVLPEPFLEMLEGLRYIFYVRPGRVVPGMKTAHSGPPLCDEIHAEEKDVYVWPDPKGSIRGQEIKPLHSCVPAAAKKDLDLYKLLNLVEALRVGRTRERKMAMELLEGYFKAHKQL